MSFTLTINFKIPLTVSALLSAERGQLSLPYFEKGRAGGQKNKSVSGGTLLPWMYAWGD